MYHFQLFKRKWPIVIRYSEKLLFIELTDEVDSQTLKNIIYLMFKDYPKIALSQHYDTSQVKIGNTKKFINELEEKFSVKAKVTKTFDELEVPTEESPIFVLNIFGSTQSGLLSDVVRFGPNNLANIIYGMESDSGDWVSELLEWNGEIVRWYKLISKIDNKNLINLIDKSGLTAMTIDKHIFFCFTNTLSR